MHSVVSLSVSGRLHSIVRHFVGAFHGVPGARAFLSVVIPLAVFALILARFADQPGQLGIAIAKLIELGGIVPVDLFLDCRGAGHCRFRPDHRGRRAENAETV